MSTPNQASSGVLHAVMSDLPSKSAGTPPVIAVSARSEWSYAAPLAGTISFQFPGVSGTTNIAAVAETNSANAILTLAMAENATSPTLASLRCIEVPPNSTYFELGSSGDSTANGTSPVVEIWRSNHCNTQIGTNRTPIAIPAGQEDWERLYTVTGAANVTFSGTVLDATGVAGSARYVVDEGTYQSRMYDVRGARMVVVRVTTIGTNGNWNLKYRFF